MTFEINRQELLFRIVLSSVTVLDAVGRCLLRTGTHLSRRISTPYSGL